MPIRSGARQRACPARWGRTLRHTREDVGLPCRKTTGGPAAAPAPASRYVMKESSTAIRRTLASWGEEGVVVAAVVAVAVVVVAAAVVVMVSLRDVGAVVPQAASTSAAPRIEVVFVVGFAVVVVRMPAV